MHQETVFETKNLKIYYPIYKGLIIPKLKGHIKAVDGISIKLNKGEIIGLVGESGCGKSSFIKGCTMLERPTGGDINYKNINLVNLTDVELKPIRRNIQMIFQNPFSSLDPFMTIKDILEEPLKEFSIGNKEERKYLICDIIEKVGLNSNRIYNYPSNFSGGQRQRFGIARALIVRPEIIFADEPVSSLDVSIQAQIINLMLDLRENLNFSMVFISHDLSVTKHISDNIAVMYLGRIVEYATYKELFSDTMHPYTKALISSIPGNKFKNSNKFKIKGDISSGEDLIRGCKFEPRCPLSKPHCKENSPILEEKKSGHFVECWEV